LRNASSFNCALFARVEVRARLGNHSVDGVCIAEARQEEIQREGDDKREEVPSGATSHAAQCRKAEGDVFHGARS
jgi:hypothetical protein